MRTPHVTNVFCLVDVLSRYLGDGENMILVFPTLNNSFLIPNDWSTGSRCLILGFKTSLLYNYYLVCLDSPVLKEF